MIAIGKRLPDRRGGGAHQADHVGGKLTSPRGISFPAHLDDGIVASRSTPPTAVTEKLDFVSTVRGQVDSDGDSRTRFDKKTKAGYEFLGIVPR
ncbi:MAG TPA: hypothetical protein VE111_12140 [Bradyrhizobium sp.]|nr:hypothetical protein [Bradyrhizobium sp.]